tara:strand:- start:18 stop:335 length:318 start_codon:yes stop_codon:yes gene_type:complete
MNYNDKPQPCKGCGIEIPFGNYHKKCYKSRMDTTTYEDLKMDAENYPVSHNGPMHEETREEQYGHLYKALGTVAATNWIVENTGEDINMEEIFRKIMEGEIDYDE